MFFKILKLFFILNILLLFLLNFENREKAAYSKTLKNASSGNMIKADKLKKMIELYNQYLTSSNSKDKLLLSIGQMAMQMKISIEEFNEKMEYKSICHLRVAPVQ